MLVFRPARHIPQEENGRVEGRSMERNQGSHYGGICVPVGIRRKWTKTRLIVSKLMQKAVSESPLDYKELFSCGGGG